MRTFLPSLALFQNLRHVNSLRNHSPHKMPLGYEEGTCAELCSLLRQSKDRNRSGSSIRALTKSIDLKNLNCLQCGGQGPAGSRNFPFVDKIEHSLEIINWDLVQSNEQFRPLRLGVLSTEVINDSVKETRGTGDEDLVTKDLVPSS